MTLKKAGGDCVMDTYSQLLNLVNATKLGEIPIQHGSTWSLRSAPHAIVAGPTGYGKTYFVNYLISALSIKGCELYLADPKNADLASLADYMPSAQVASDKNDIIDMVDRVEQMMRNRYTWMKEERRDRELFQSDFIDFGLHPVILVFDELAAFVAMLDKKQRERFESKIKSITLQGRQAGVELISVMQSPNANNISTESRSQSGFRVFLGNSGGVEYRMLFGEGLSFRTHCFQPGQGLYTMVGKTEVPEIIETPRFAKHDLPSLLRKALAHQFKFSIERKAEAMLRCSEAEAQQACPGGSAGTRGQTTTPLGVQVPSELFRGDEND